MLAFSLQQLPAQVWAQELEGTPVLAVRHQPETPGESPMQPAALARIITQQSGQPYSSRAIRESIERLFATGRFADIQVDAQREAGGIILTFLTKSRYFVGAVLVRGVEAPPSESQLRAAVKREGHNAVPAGRQPANSLLTQLHLITPQNGAIQDNL